jgi:hypothetical protein
LLVFLIILFVNQTVPSINRHLVNLGLELEAAIIALVGLNIGHLFSQRQALKLTRKHSLKKQKQSKNFIILLYDSLGPTGVLGFYLILSFFVVLVKTG